MSQKKDELRHAIQEDFERMGEVVKSLSQLQTRITRLKDPALIRMTVKAAAGELHDYYTAFEFIAKRVLMLEGITIDLPEGRWHKALSQAAVKHQLVSEAHMPLLDDLRNFRHVVRCGYGVEYNTAAVSEKIEKAVSAWPDLEQGLRAKSQIEAAVKNQPASNSPVKRSQHRKP